MKAVYKLSMMLVGLMVLALTAKAQDDRDLQYFRSPGYEGLNVFETPKVAGEEFDGVEVRVGGDFAMQWQGLSQENDLVGDTLVDLDNNLNLPAANLNIDVQLADGLRMHLRTYLSSRHHSEAWVKGGYIQIDKLDFIEEGFLSGLMDFTTIKVGMDEINYGDAHFRRSDNAKTIYNPFVGNYIMDAFTTEPYFEVTFQPGSFIGVLGITNGRLNQSTVQTPNSDGGFVFYGKAGFDNQVSDDLRLRLTGSIYSSSENSTRDYIYGGDRAGARYFNVMHGKNVGGSDSEPRFNPGYAYQTAIQINPFIKYQGLEFFGIFEVTNNGDSDIGGGYTQIGTELLYRFGGNDQLYVGGRYNAVSGERTDGAESQNINRINIGGGWFMTDNVLAKIEYVSQNYDGDGWNGTKYQGAQFSGVVLEAAISF